MVSRIYHQLNTYKIKDKIGQWDTSYNNNRKIETTLARLRLNSVKFIHLIPRIEGTYPLQCNCDGTSLTLYHMFFNCSFYITQREQIINKLYEDKKNLTL